MLKQPRFKVTPIYYSHRNAVADGFNGTMLDWDIAQERFYTTNKIKNNVKIREALYAFIQTEASK